jgi:hypothetical protein
MPGTFFAPHPPYSPGLVPSDSHLFTHLRKFMCCTRMRGNEEVKNRLKTGSMDWRQNSTMHANRSASVFMGIVGKNDLRSVVIM